jgi:hypothetical protein
MPLMIAVALLVVPLDDAIRVRDLGSLRAAISQAKPGTRILMEPGDYPGGIMVSNLHGQAGKLIVIGGADPAKPPRIVGGGGIHLSDVSYLELRDVVIEGARANGLNVDDGGTYDTPTHHVTLRNIVVRDLPKGNNDGIKLSGIDDFLVTNCLVERWGGSGVDMVGCHRGVIAECTFRSGGDSGVQGKGGTSDVVTRRCRFEDYGQRGINLGGSTGLPYFRPPVEKMPANARYEARNLTVEGCTFSGGVAPLAFVGVDGATVRFNTIYHPGRWAMRILQETRTPDFLPSRNGVFEDNIVVFRSDQWFEGGVNIGPGTQPDTFKFARNWWFCSDRPDRSQPKLPSAVVGGVVGRDPNLKPDLSVSSDSPAKAAGAGALPKRS